MSFTTSKGLTLFTSSVAIFSPSLRIVTLSAILNTSSMWCVMNIIDFESEYLSKRPEQLSVEEFINLTNQVQEHMG
jgi:16S rRNA A1518/A1519 N6-dimethyltransferase RsmA/KsgA/DIM1 with predicted DNA glycosylase/AP lyase activity